MNDDNLRECAKLLSGRIAHELELTEQTIEGARAMLAPHSVRAFANDERAACYRRTAAMQAQLDAILDMFSFPPAVFSMEALQAAARRGMENLAAARDGEPQPHPHLGPTRP